MFQSNFKWLAKPTTSFINATKNSPTQVPFPPINKETFYLPVYMRFKIKNVDEINMDNMTASINGALIMTIHYGQMEDYLLNQFIVTHHVGDDAAG